LRHSFNVNTVLEKHKIRHRKWETEEPKHEGRQQRKPNLQLKHERELRGWSQGDVAEKIGADAHTVYRWEHGITIPTPFFRQRLCELFNKNARELGLLSDQKYENDELPLGEPLPEHQSTSTTLPAKPTEKAPML